MKINPFTIAGLSIAFTLAAPHAPKNELLVRVVPEEGLREPYHEVVPEEPGSSEEEYEDDTPYSDDEHSGNESDDEHEDEEYEGDGFGGEPSSRQRRPGATPLQAIQEIIDEPPEEIRGRLQERPVITIARTKPTDPDYCTVWRNDRDPRNVDIHAYYGKLDMPSSRKVMLALNGKPVREYGTQAFKTYNRPFPDSGALPRRPDLHVDRSKAYDQWLTRVFHNAMVDFGILRADVAAYEDAKGEAGLASKLMQQVEALQRGEKWPIFLHYGPDTEAKDDTNENAIHDSDDNDDPPPELMYGPGYSKAKHQDTQRWVRAVRNPHIKRTTINDTTHPAQQAYLVDASDTPSNLTSSSQQRFKRDILTTVTKQESSVSSGGTHNTTASLSNDLSLIKNAFLTVQSNISSTIFPYLRTMTASSNASIVYDAAWSIWADLTAASEMVIGPFYWGLHCIDALENEYAQQHNLTINDTAMQNLLVVDAILIDLYETTWSQAFAAVNGSGLLAQLATLGGYLAVSNTSAGKPDSDNQFFLSYNKSLQATGKGG